ncbi:MAG: hypothetical protein IPJ99_12190 [Betaproteobacteria bacterium]|nr:hypothetical protein [Betaproteobacteria bacterium]
MQMIDVEAQSIAQFQRLLIDARSRLKLEHGYQHPVQPLIGVAQEQGVTAGRESLIAHLGGNQVCSFASESDEVGASSHVVLEQNWEAIHRLVGVKRAVATGGLAINFQDVFDRAYQPLICWQTGGALLCRGRARARDIPILTNSMQDRFLDFHIYSREF